MEFLTNYMHSLGKYVEAMWRAIVAVHHSFPPEIQHTFVLLALARPLFEIFVELKQYISEKRFCSKNAITHEEYSKAKTNAVKNAIKELEETYSKKSQDNLSSHQ
ncbi:hypothetical protein [Helicobacter pylori]|uniref:hypothetical protein n=1 Tax=Helicobacter pylori TaxID=210 RepID=UPI000FDF1746|nr:hypothetical protein [Helicobacter pylori]RVZ78700.1 hypothetical protein EC590_03120 [Helicobacter pylori]